MNTPTNTKNTDRKKRLKKYLSITVLLLMLPVAGLWSWNTIAELADIPLIQYKHALAGMVFILTVSWTIRHPRHQIFR